MRHQCHIQFGRIAEFVIECLGLGVDRPQRAVDLLGVGIFDLHLDMAVHG